jgi:putative membrane protein
MNLEAIVSFAVVAHVGAPPVPANLASDWSFDPVLLFAACLATFLYYRGLQRLWKPAGSKKTIPPWRADCFAAALAVTLVALVSPLDALSSALFSAHMVQHLLLITVAAPLFVLAAPAVPMVLGLPNGWRRRLLSRIRTPRARYLAQFLTRASVAFIVAVSVLWIWHIPTLYELALRNQVVHALEHSLLLGTATLFWLSVLPANHRRGLKSPTKLLVGVALLAGMAVQGTILGIAIAFSSQPWYPTYALTSSSWGLRPTVDQQIAGLIMWIPAGAIYILAALLILGYVIASPAEMPNGDKTLVSRGRTLDVVEGLEQA